jgi:hypothetical protein
VRGHHRVLDLVQACGGPLQVSQGVGRLGRVCRQRHGHRVDAHTQEGDPLRWALPLVRRHLEAQLGQEGQQPLKLLLAVLTVRAHHNAVVHVPHAADAPGARHRRHFSCVEAGQEWGSPQAERQLGELPELPEHVPYPQLGSRLRRDSVVVKRRPQVAGPAPRPGRQQAAHVVQAGHAEGHAGEDLVGARRRQVDGEAHLDLRGLGLRMLRAPAVVRQQRRSILKINPRQRLDLAHVARLHNAQQRSHVLEQLRVSRYQHSRSHHLVYTRLDDGGKAPADGVVSTPPPPAGPCPRHPLSLAPSLAPLTTLPPRTLQRRALLRHHQPVAVG